MVQADDAIAIFETHRPRLLRLAYRMLGSMAEAEDLVQDAWLRWGRVDTEDVNEPSAYLTRTVTRLCLDAMKSARAQRETYIGSWLHEPIAEPQPEAMRLDDLTLTLMLALERLSPLERAAFLLHDVFDVALDELAATLGRDAGAVRQLAVRARKHVKAARPRYPVDRAEGERMAQAFFTASASGDLNGLRSILAENVVLRSDGGGKALAFLNPIVGLERALRLYDGLHQKASLQRPRLIQWMWIDGLPGYLSRGYGGVLETTALAIEGGRITGIFITRNPDKLKYVAEEAATKPLSGRAV